MGYPLISWSKQTNLYFKYHKSNPCKVIEDIEYAMGNNKKGRNAENFVCGQLKKRGFVIIGTNVYVRYGEIDIIAFKDRITYFFEVKSSYSSIDPLELYTKNKRRKLKRSVTTWILQKGSFNTNRFKIFVICMWIRKSGIKTRIIDDSGLLFC